MTMDETLFFRARPTALPLSARLREQLLAFAGAELTVQATQNTFRAGAVFACVSLRRLRGCPPEGLLVSFGLGRRLSSPRVAQAVEPYPGRWTHHVSISTEEELDAELLGWLREAWDFARQKRPRHRT